MGMEVVRSPGDRPVGDAAQMDGGEVEASCDPESNGEAEAEAEAGRGGSSGGARYKLMSPAKLPISRSPCLTIPPGLSPSSFLESPVLLSNVKAEPSPTTGSFFKPQMVHGYGGSTLFSTIINNSVAMDGSKSGCFEFQTTSGSNSAACLFVPRPLASADTNNQQSNQGMQAQAQSSHHSFASSATTRGDGVASSSELSLSAPSQKDVPNDSMQTDCDESNQKLLPGDEVQVPRADHCGITLSTNERASDDGYNWRKYGQKLVKGSEHPRSYYKCTHPNCEVKKLFERAPDGQIAEIVYKGTHDHPKPQLNRRLSTGSTMSIQEERSEKFSSHAGLEDKAPTFSGQMTQNKDPTATAEPSHPVANENNVEVGLSQLNKIPEDDDNDDDDPFAKRRKMEISGMDINSVIKPIREPRVVVQTLSEVDILDDGYRWRKYGQKVVRGNPNPRSYYKCTSVGCPVRKHVERASHDPKAVITTYEGKHNHDVPTARNNNHDTAAAAAASPASRPRPQDGDTVSLDLGVGISSGADNTPEPAPGQPRMVNSNLLYLHPAAMSAYPGFVNGTMLMMQGAAENHVEGNPPLSRSTTNPYPQSIGRLLMGP